MPSRSVKSVKTVTWKVSKKQKTSRQSIAKRSAKKTTQEAAEQARQKRKRKCQGMTDQESLNDFWNQKKRIYQRVKKDLALSIPHLERKKAALQKQNARHPDLPTLKRKITDMMKKANKNRLNIYYYKRLMQTCADAYDLQNPALGDIPEWE